MKQQPEKLPTNQHTTQAADKQGLGVVETELTSDLMVKEDESVKGGEFAGQTIRIRIASTNNQGL